MPKSMNSQVIHNSNNFFLHWNLLDKRQLERHALSYSCHLRPQETDEQFPEAAWFTTIPTHSFIHSFIHKYS